MYRILIKFVVHSRAISTSSQQRSNGVSLRE